MFGATGSIGASALDVIARHPERFEVEALSAHRDVAKLVGLCQRFRPRVAVIADAALIDPLQNALRDAGLATEALGGLAALESVAADAGSDARASRNVTATSTIATGAGQGPHARLG